MKSKVQTLIFIIIILLFVGYLSGYRLTGLSAARANSFVPKDSVLLDTVDYSWGSIYIFDSPEKPVSAISTKTLGLMWSSRLSAYHYHSDDPVQTIGGVSYGDSGEEATVLSVLINDPEVSYIEAGPEGNRTKKEARIGEPLTFSWDEAFQLDRLSPQAFNNNGELLYEYKYPVQTIIDPSKLKWYPVDTAAQQS
ncbi:hypothetical protein [Paenibacillus camerounensis]|uniref:hypothetical protein n=1 Tax=Paenibacillus camerounensis TaxID=1243663 RepID=UPI0005A8AAE8|nr:hypothetical protein [Paenibacillus camerounensis]